MRERERGNLILGKRLTQNLARNVFTRFMNVWIVRIEAHRSLNFYNFISKGISLLRPNFFGYDSYSYFTHIHLHHDNMKILNEAIRNDVLTERHEGRL